MKYKNTLAAAILLVTAFTGTQIFAETGVGKNTQNGQRGNGGQDGQDGN